METNFYARKSRLKAELTRLNPTLKDYLIREGLDLPKDIIGGNYKGEFTEGDRKKVARRWLNRGRIVTNLETLCETNGIDLSKLDEAKKYVTDALGL